MKCFRPALALFLVVLVAFVAASLLETTTSRGQSKDTRKATGGASDKPLVKPTAGVRKTLAEPPIGNAARSSAFGPPAMRNALLYRELKWTFGGKPQRGWFLYKALINKLLRTEAEPATEDFALALSRWQAKSGLLPSGMLDEETLNAMVAQWQSARLKERGYPQPDQLLVAPAAEFYDPTRPDELRQVERKTYAAYHRMIAAAVADSSLGLTADADGKLAPNEKYLKLLSTFRSREYQEKLRRESPKAGRAGLAVNSPHFTGRALDLYVGGEPVETNDANRAIQVQTRVYQWLVRNADRFGFRPYYYEPWHWEYVN
jgi:zinc D-Ala-D-Ala carboxypeptidase